jgi:endonuclease/exonuclease/phosphatase family metal-dependent hydrolase
MTTVSVNRMIATAIALAALLVGSMAVANDAAAATQHKIGTFNMAGGHAGHGPKVTEPPEALVASIQDHQPAFVLVQEACDDWMRVVDDALADYTAVFDPVTSADGTVPSCKHPGSQFGNAIVYRNDFGVDGPPEAHSLGSPAGLEQREMLCVTASSRNAVICSTHLSVANAEARIIEADTVNSILATRYAGYTALVGGDFNAEPGSEELGRFYHVGYGDGAVGGLKEADSPCGGTIAPTTPDYIGENPVDVSCRDGESTHDDVWIQKDWVPDVEIEEGPLHKKIDYLFVSPSVQVLSADATFGIHSDHDPLWADVAF